MGVGVGVGGAISTRAITIACPNCMPESFFAAFREQEGSRGRGGDGGGVGGCVTIGQWCPDESHPVHPICIIKHPLVKHIDRNHPPCLLKKNRVGVGGGGGVC